ncbi:hypothetical protein QWZ13_06480 [Reinekea marina]|uniref:hypothetical protein n=1 Tax=Reinekea marina TaxID=1310421 RepID=UPI0025B2B3D5|nr:hypothetical protein [Reinekea marina]MDN3648555.1 hypothetical protein [Reinekea marina]
MILYHPKLYILVIQILFVCVLFGNSHNSGALANDQPQKKILLPYCSYRRRCLNH